MDHEKLASEIARIVAAHLEGGREFDQMPHDRAALRKWNREGMCLINDATQDDAIRLGRELLPIIAREVAAETERCARVAESRTDPVKDGPISHMVARSIAAAIRGRAINAAMDAEGEG